MSGRGLRGRGAAPADVGPSGVGRGLLKRDPIEGEPSAAAVAADTPPPSTGRGRGLARKPAAATTTPAVPAAGLGASQESVTSSRAEATAPAQAEPLPSRGAGRGLRGRGLTTAGRGLSSAASSKQIPEAAASGDVGQTKVSSEPLQLTELEKALSALPSIGSHSRRKASGTLGRPIHLRSNCYALEYPDAIWHKYDVVIFRANEEEPMELENVDKVKNRERIASRRLNRVIMFKVIQTHSQYFRHGYPAYDGRKILTAKNRLFEEQKKIFVVDIETFRGRKVEFSVRLTHVLPINVSSVKAFYTGQTNMLDAEVTQAVNIVIDAQFASGEWIAVNRSYYNPASPARELGGGKELREGIYTSAMFAEWRPLLIVDKSRTAFSKAQRLMDLAKSVLNVDMERCSGLNSRQVETLKREARGLMVRLEHSGYGRSAKIAGITLTGADQTFFEDHEGKKIRVVDYFREAYPKFRLRFPHLPCIEVKRANGRKTDYFPIEVCTIKKDQPSRKKLNPEQTAAMIKFAQEKPHDRMRSCDQNVQVVKRQTGLIDFGVRISEKPTETQGKQLDSPGITVNRQQLPPTQGSWRLPCFHEGAVIRSWVVVDCAGVRPNLMAKLADLLGSLADRMRMQVRDRPQVLGDSWRSTREMLAKVKSYHRDTSGKLLAVIVIGQNNISYSEIKSLTETSSEFPGIVTQCVRAENMRDDKLKPAFVDNLLKKINVKLGGVNSLVTRIPKRFEEPFMLLGADVSHPGAGDVMTPSIAAVVGTLDMAPSRYCTEVSVQCGENNNRIEYIVRLREIVLKLLRKHVKFNDGRKPKRIYYLRDGVSDGQFEEVRRREVMAIREACYDLQAFYQPFVTVIVAQKRHHVRFSVTDPRTGTRSGNVPPGTYIDKDVVHPINHDLYMYTHEGLIGTSRPTHYQIIHSDDAITTDEITEMIYYLTHNYARASRSVSIPSPIYYAHLAAFRAKEHVKADPTLCGSSAASTTSDGALTPADLKRFQQACEVDEDTKQLLYYA